MIIIEAIILAGGYSSRSNCNKMLLEFEGKPIIMHVVDTFKSVCSRVIVVTGHYHKELSVVLKDLDKVTIVENENYPLGMFSSVMKGVVESSENFFLLPGDIPLIKEDVLQKLLEAEGVIRVPSHNNKLGHPIYIDRSLKMELLNEPIDSNLKTFRNKHQITYVTVDDLGILIDIDTQEDYKNLKEMERNNNHEC